MDSIRPKYLVSMGLMEAPPGFRSHEFTLFTTALSYAAAPPWFWTASAQLGDLDSQPEYVTQDFNGLQTRRLWFNPVLDSSVVAV